MLVLQTVSWLLLVRVIQRFYSNLAFSHQNLLQQAIKSFTIFLCWWGLQFYISSTHLHNHNLLQPVIQTHVIPSLIFTGSWWLRLDTANVSPLKESSSGVGVFAKVIFDFCCTMGNCIPDNLDAVILWCSCPFMRQKMSRKDFFHQCS